MTMITLLCFAIAVVIDNIAISALTITIGAIIFITDYAIKRKRTYKSGNFRKFG